MSKLAIGISSCLLGQAVRFDGGHKGFHFAMKSLADFVDYIDVCPEMGIGMPSPRPALRLNLIDNQIRMTLSQDESEDYTEKMNQFSEKTFEQFPLLSGYIVCAKSPSCGLERVRIYNPVDKSNKKIGTGIYTSALIKKFPWLPIEEDGRLNDPLIRENFVGRIFALHELQTIMQNGLTKAKFVQFHTQYKLILLSHSQSDYRLLGKKIAQLNTHDDLAKFYAEYRLQLMETMSKIANRRNHTNVLMHIQGYFKKFLTPEQKAELSDVVLRYHKGLLPLLSPLTLFIHYMNMFDITYLKSQRYFNPYPETLRLRYGY
ncbi:YbgA family protein [Thorsellia kenyensis]|uniref:YbgA family protein n=1 Tax=Thorsellia kenyensis TaxID=1549888 RepID=A0ABV6CBQ4_9GAMM